MIWKHAGTQMANILFPVFLAGVLTMGCSSTPETPSEPSKQEIRQDADRFFQKMGQEEDNQTPSP